MFKKVPNLKASSNLKNSERKKLLRSCKEQTEVVDYSFPTSVIKQSNFNGQSSVGTAYTDENNIPIWFKEKHSEFMFPSVYTCWQNPDLLPIILTHDFVIEDKIFNGANLMISGTILPFDNRLKPTVLCGIASSQNPKTIMAVGIVQLDTPSYSSVIGQTGVAVKVCHHMGDGLSIAFKMTMEPPIITTSIPEDAHIDNRQIETEIKITEESVKDNSEKLDDMAEVLEVFTVDIVDNFITRALYYTLTQDPKIQYPIPASTFISNHIMRNMPPIDPNLVNLKKSSWKKSAKFLKHFEKESFIKLKGKGEDLVITGCNKEKNELKTFVPYTVGKNNNSSKNGETKSNPSDDMMYTVSYYKPINVAKRLVEVSDLPPKILYTAQDIKELVTAYISKKKLVDLKNKKMIILDDILYDLVYKKKNTVLPRCVSRAEIMDPILQNNFTEHFQIFKNEDTALFKHPMRGMSPRVKIFTEMKIGRKIITRVSNFEVFLIDPNTLAGDLRKLCSGSTTIGETATSPKIAEVQVQGPHGQIIINHLNSLSIPTKWIDFENKLKPKRKRN